MTWTIRDVRTNELLVETEYSRHSSAIRSFNNRLLTPQTAYIADEKWREREQVRPKLLNLEQFGLTAIPDHFLHVSIKSTYDEFLVSYTENPVKGSKNIQAAGRKIGRYIKEFYPDLTSENIEKLSHEIVATVNKLPVEFHTTPEGIRDIYLESNRTDGMASCMTHDTSNWGLTTKGDRHSVHPTEAYGSGEIGVAVLRNDQNKIRARVLVWTAKKLFSRFYGPDALKLKSLLEQAGYKNGRFEGAPLKMIEIHNDGRNKSHIHYAVPYIDQDRYVYLDEKGQLRIGSHDGTPVESNTTGFLRFIRYIDEISGENMTDGQALAVNHPRDGSACYVRRSTSKQHTIIVEGRTYAKVNYPEDGVTSNADWVMIEGETTLIPLYVATQFRYMSVKSGKYIAKGLEVALNRGYVSITEFVEFCDRCEMYGVADLRTNLILMPHGRYWSRVAVDNYGHRANGVWTSKYHHLPPIETVDEVA